MPECRELTVVQEVLNRRILGQTITSAEVIPPGGAIVVRDRTGDGFAAALMGATFEGVARRGQFLVFTLTAATKNEDERRMLIVRLLTRGDFVAGSGNADANVW